MHGEPIEVVTHGRHDPCVGLRATPIAEAMLAIVIMDHWLRHRGQNADVKTNTLVFHPPREFCAARSRARLLLAVCCDGSAPPIFAAVSREPWL